MAYLFVESSASSNTSVVQSAVKALKLLFFSAGLISTLLMVKEAAMPFLHETFFPNLIAIWSLFTCLFSSPLYICIIINSVVFLIAATSTFHHHDPPPPPPGTTLLSSIDSDDCNIIYSHTTQISVGKAGLSSLNSEVLMPEGHEDEDEKMGDSLSRDIEGEIGLSPLNVEVLASEGHEDEVEKAGDSLSRDELESSLERENDGDDTLDSTWKAIVGDKSKKLTKSESVHVTPESRTDDLYPSTVTWKELRKLETFNEGVSVRRLGGLRRDPSVGIDEFNQQVESFIKKFNQDMRLQRQESDQRFLDMTRRELQ